MKTYVLAYVLIFTFFYSNSYAQEFKLGKVSVAELEEKAHQKDSSAVADYLNKNIPQDRLSSVGHINAGNVFTTKVVPGIGHVTDIIPAESGFDGRVMTGRYGTGSATFSDKPRTTGGTITENGKKVPIAGWFNDAARRQGESNQFFNKDGRKIVPDKKGESQKFS